MTKMLFGALALALSSAAVAQSAPAAHPHAGHADHAMPADHPGHDGHAHDHSTMADHDCMAHCKEMMQKDGKMECMDSAKGEKAPAHQHAH